MADDGWVLVDDRDPGITYASSGGLIYYGGVPPEYMETTTDLEPGDTATYYFNASRIAVFGTYSPGGSDPSIAIYQVDSTPATTVTGPVTQATLYRQNFWTSNSQLPSLAPGAFHELVITATSSNSSFWIDYFAYLPTSTSSSTSSTPTTSPTTSSIGSQTSSPPGHSNTNTNVGAVVAGIVVGAVALIVASAALLIYMRRRRGRHTPGDYLTEGEVNVSPDTSHNHRTLSEDDPFAPNVPQRGSLRGELLGTPPLTPARAFDGGVSVMGGPLQIPPEYQEYY